MWYAIIKWVTIKLKVYWLWKYLKIKIVMMILLKLPLIVGKKLRSLYENGWFESNTEYCHENICKHHFPFNDDSEVYLGEDDIDMIEVTVFWKLQQGQSTFFSCFVRD